ncbi:hypothetical protein [Parasphingorhabdus sp.]|uniref:hypothetical protein n=1 Tax=Parasphingorhabdus sp. TaxID=2709688 RepID=UPI003D2BF57B
MKIKTTLSIFAISIGSLAAMPALAMVSQERPDQIVAEVVPEGLIIVKILPATEIESIAKSSGPRKITNRRDPEYVRCRMEPVVGSTLKKRKICMTNREWKLAIRKGNTYANEFVADSQAGFFIP